MDNQFKLIIIIPCYNEEYRLPQQDFLDFISVNDIHFCFVNDGSSDRTIDVLQRLKEAFSDKISIIDYENNVGKAEAIRKGVHSIVSQRKYEYIGYFDADLSTPLKEIQLLLNSLEIGDLYEFSFGARVLRLGSIIERSSLRHYLSRLFATFASMILKLPVYDTQCGAKIFKIKLAQIIFMDPFITNWLFDIELFARTKNVRMGVQPFIEIPLNQWIEKEGSKIKLRDMFMFPLELMKISNHYSKK